MREDPLSVVLHPEIERALQERVKRILGEERRSPLTAEAYERATRDFAVFLTRRAQTPLSLSELFGLELRDYRAWMASLADLSARSASLALSAARSWTRDLERRGEIGPSAVLSLRFPKKSELLPKPLAHEDFLRLREAWPELFPADSAQETRRDFALLTLLYGAGLRISEALALPLIAICPVTPEHLLILGKGKKTRRVPLTPPVRAALDAYAAPRHLDATPDEPLFTGVRGARLNPSAVRAKMVKARRLLGLPETASPHALRHSYATELLAADPSKLKVLQELLGHAGLSTTQIYAKVRPGSAALSCIKLHPRGALPRDESDNRREN